MTDIFVPEHWQKICNNVKEIVEAHIFPFVRSKRVLSSIMSELFENQSADYFNSIGIKTKACNNDKEPDLYFIDTDSTCEIKVTSSKNREWMGNHISKKNSEYVLISWEHIKEHGTLFGTVPENIEFSVINVFLEQSDWKTLGAEYNGTKITSKTLEGKTVKVLV
jgi:hypothetical protein